MATEKTYLFSSEGSTKKSAVLEWKKIAHDELHHMTILAFPVIITYLLEFLPCIVSLMLVGHIKNEDTKMLLDATAFAVMFMNLTGISIGLGLATAMDTLCSQAYGAGQSIKMGTYLQTGGIVLSVAFLPICVCNLYCTEILLALDQPQDVAKCAGQFVRYMLPGIPFLFMYELLKKIMQAQNVATPMLTVAVLANVINVVVGYYLVYCTSFGYLGAAVAQSVSNMSLFLLLIPYLIRPGVMDVFWNGLQVQKAIDGLGEFIRLGVSGMFMMCFQWWAFELVALISGWLPNAISAIGANAILLNLSSCTFMFYLGIAVSGNVRIGNALGAGDPKRAMVASVLSIVLASIVALILAGLLLVFQNTLPTWFTIDDDIIKYVPIFFISLYIYVLFSLTQQAIFVTALFQLSDGVNGAVQGSFRGLGKLALGAKLNFVGYYVVGLPLGALFAFTYGMGLIGLWLGMTVGLACICVAGGVLLYNTNWEKMSQEAKDRILKTDCLPTLS